MELESGFVLIFECFLLLYEFMFFLQLEIFLLYITKGAE